jgi:hypothetical protein
MYAEWVEQEKKKIPGSQSPGYTKNLGTGQKTYKLLLN